jgi:hypothetical protein
MVFEERERDSNYDLTYYTIIYCTNYFYFMSQNYLIIQSENKAVRQQRTRQQATILFNFQR